MELRKRKAVQEEAVEEEQDEVYDEDSDVEDVDVYLADELRQDEQRAPTRKRKLIPSTEPKKKVATTATAGRKKKASNAFEEQISVTRLKQLLVAAGAKASGTKSSLRALCVKHGLLEPEDAPVPQLPGEIILMILQSFIELRITTLNKPQARDVEANDSSDDSGEQDGVTPLQQQKKRSSNLIMKQITEVYLVCDFFCCLFWIGYNTVIIIISPFLSILNRFL